MPRQTKPTIEQVVAAIHAKAGNVSAAARNLGVSRMFIYRRINEKRGKAVWDAIEEERERLNDDADSVLASIIRGSSVDPALRLKAAIFVKTHSPQAKREGWSGRTEVTGADGGPITVEAWKSEMQKRREDAAETVALFEGDEGGDDVES